VRALIFDLDGTLVDSYEAIAVSLNRAREAFGQTHLDTASIRRAVGRGLESLVADLVGPEHVEEGVRLFRERYAQVFLTGTRALPGAVDTLRELRARGYRLSVASNKPARFGRPILREAGLLPFVDHVQGPDLSGTTKPEPEMLRNCMEAMGSDVQETVYVGDMVLDVESAARAGLPVILVCGGSSSVEELRSTGQRVLESLTDLPGLLSRPQGKTPCPVA
jgi:phosphoglycolate phosphatase